MGKNLVLSPYGVILLAGVLGLSTACSGCARPLMPGNAHPFGCACSTCEDQLDEEFRADQAEIVSEELRNLREMESREPSYHRAAPGEPNSGIGVRG